MNRCAADTDKVWSKGRELSRPEAAACRAVAWGPEVPEEALPYLTSVTRPDELRELAEILREDLTRLQYARLVSGFQRVYGRAFVQRSGLPTGGPEMRCA
jgi:hypothetical protein